MRTLEECFRQRGLQVGRRDAGEPIVQQKDERRHRLERLFDEWEARVKSLLGRAGGLLWPNEGKAGPRGRASEWQVISDRRNLRWQLRKEGH